VEKEQTGGAAMMGMIVFITYYGCRLAERIKAKK
jgi:hypothetical protein